MTQTALEQRNANEEPLDVGRTTCVVVGGGRRGQLWPSFSPVEASR